MTEHPADGVTIPRPDNPNGLPPRATSVGGMQASARDEQRRAFRDLATALATGIEQQTRLLDQQKTALGRILRTEIWLVIAMGLISLATSAIATYWIHQHRHRELVVELNRDWRQAFNDVARTQWNRYLHWVDNHRGETHECLPLIYQGINAASAKLDEAIGKHSGFRELLAERKAKAPENDRPEDQQDRLELLKRTLIGVLNIMETVAVMRQHSVGDAHLIDVVYKDTVPRYYRSLLGFIGQYVHTHRNAWRPLDSLVLEWDPQIAEQPEWRVIQEGRNRRR
jgi:hypothetical protein